MILFVNPRATRPSNRRFPLSVMAVGAALPPDTSWEIVQLLSRINLRGTTVIVSSHDKTIVDVLRKRVIALDGGVVVRDEERGLYAGGR